MKKLPQMKQNQVQKKLNNLPTRDYKFLIGRIYFFGDNGSQNMFFINQHLIRQS